MTSLSDSAGVSLLCIGLTALSSQVTLIDLVDKVDDMMLNR